jgi:hypothetical protein
MAFEGEHPISAEDRERYSEILKEMGTRMRGAREYLAEEPTVATIEYAALQLRKVVELIVMASLVTNRAAVEQITAALARKSVDDARKLARNANDEYWPKAIRVGDDETLEGRPDDEVLTEDDWGRVYGKLSELLHARNPFAPPLDVADAHTFLSGVSDRVTNLLSKHIMLLAGADFLLMGEISAEEVAVITMGRAPNGWSQP